METPLERNLKRGLQPLRTRGDDVKAAFAEDIRDFAFTGIEELIREARDRDPAQAQEWEQQVKLLKLRNQAGWWLYRAGWLPKTLLRSA